MRERNITLRLKKIFTDDEMARITLDASHSRPTLTVDIHGMGCREAKAFIKNVIAIFREACLIIIIHGHNHGTALQQMVRKENFGTKVAAVHPWYWNDGVTEMSVRALCEAA